MKKWLVLCLVFWATAAQAQETTLPEALHMNCLARRAILMTLKEDPKDREMISELVKVDRQVIQLVFTCVTKDEACAKHLFSPEEKEAAIYTLADFASVLQKGDEDESARRQLELSSTLCGYSQRAFERVDPLTAPKTPQADSQ